MKFIIIRGFRDYGPFGFSSTNYQEETHPLERCLNVLKYARRKRYMLLLTNRE